MNVIVVNGNPGDSAMTQDIQDHEELQPTFILEVTTDAVITLDQSHTRGEESISTVFRTER